jgi:hypothetical protein
MIDKLSNMNETYRFLKRSTIAYENLGAKNMRQFNIRHNELRKMAEMHNDLIDQNEYLARQK